MHATVRVCSARVHTPLIHFIGKRQWPAKPESLLPHPAGSPEYKARFPEFLKKVELSSSRSAASKSANVKDDHATYQEFWQAPTRFWNPRVRMLSEEEMEAVLSGGASLR